MEQSGFIQKSPIQRVQQDYIYTIQGKIPLFFGILSLCEDLKALVRTGFWFKFKQVASERNDFVAHGVF